MSYLEHFKLDEQPFQLTPDPDFLYWSRQHAQAKAYMESTIWLADGFVVITGDIGTGKTTLLQSFLTELGDDIVYAVVSQTQLKPVQFLQAVLTEFGFRPFDKSKVELLDMFNTFLIEQYASGKKVLLIVDEAQNLGRKVLEELRLLSGIETHKEKVLRIILAGQPELKDTLESPRLEQLIQRVRLRFHIGPLNPSELREYVEHRIAVAGGPAHLFEDETFDVIHRYTGGVPRLINTLGDTALLCGFADEKTSIGTDEIMSAVEELGWNEHPSYADRQDERRQAAPPREDESQLTQIEVRHEGKSIAMLTFPSGRAVIGRAPDSEIYIHSKFVSRHHAQLASDERGCVVEDLSSRNGVYVDNRRITIHRLQDGDVISIGMHELVYTDLREVGGEQQTESGDVQPPAGDMP
jgi:type II secretory pathway predicted ATPase ExeA